MRIARVIRIDFDSMENSKPLRRRELIAFVGSQPSVYEQAARFVETLPIGTTGFYLGWDGAVYPRFEVEFRDAAPADDFVS